MAKRTTMTSMRQTTMPRGEFPAFNASRREFKVNEVMILPDEPTYHARIKPILAHDDTIIVGCLRHDTIATHVVCRAKEDQGCSVFILVIAPEALRQTDPVCVLSYNPDAEDKWALMFPISETEEKLYRPLLRQMYGRVKNVKPA